MPTRDSLPLPSPEVRWRAVQSLRKAAERKMAKGNEAEARDDLARADAIAATLKTFHKPPDFQTDRQRRLASRRFR